MGLEWILTRQVDEIILTWLYLLIQLWLQALMRRFTREACSLINKGHVLRVVDHIASALC